MYDTSASGMGRIPEQTDLETSSNSRCSHGYTLGWCPLGCKRLPSVPGTELSLDPERDLNFVLRRREGQFDSLTTDDENGGRV